MALNYRDQERLIREATNLATGRYHGGIASQLGSTFGPVGRLLGGLIEVFSGGKEATDQDIIRSIAQLVRSGFEVRPGVVDAELVQAVTPGAPPVWRSGPPPILTPQDIIDAELVTTGRPPIVSTVPTIGRPGSGTRGGGSGIQQPTPSEIARTRRGRDNFIDPIIAAPSFQGDESPQDFIGNMILTPQSSNVYGFNYDERNKILYVQYNAPARPYKYTEKVSSCSGETYTMGHRRHVPGPIYAYGSRAQGVPKHVFDEMKATTSKGEFVWQKLRICGTIHGHQYPYILIAPTMMGDGGVYVPRKATRFGYRVRTVPVAGLRRRGFHRSNLPGYNSR